MFHLAHKSELARNCVGRKRWGAENKYHRMGKLVCFGSRERDPSYYLIHGPLVVSAAVSASYSSNWKGREKEKFPVDEGNRERIVTEKLHYSGRSSSSSSKSG